MWAKIKNELTIENALALVAFGLISYGVYLVYVPAAFVVAGVLVLLVSILQGRNKSS